MESEAETMDHSANSMSFIITTGADAGYFPLVQELIASIRHAMPDAQVPVGVLDGGLLPEQCSWLAAHGVSIATPPRLAHTAKAVRKRPALAVNLGKLWLDSCFPGHETIIWLDADTWVQDRAAIDELLGAARQGALAIVPGSGRCWERQVDMHWWLGGLGQLRSFNFKNARHARLPLSVCRDLGTRALLNAGAFALRSDAPHWDVMRRWQAYILRHGKPFTSDQLAMALTTYIDGHKLELLPDWCNYITPCRVDPVRGELLEFYYPYRKIGIVHMSAKNAMRKDADATIPVLGTDGRTYQLNLRYGIMQRMIRQYSAAPMPPDGACDAVDAERLMP